MNRNYWFRLAGASLLAAFIAPDHSNYLIDFALHGGVMLALMLLTSPPRPPA